MASFDFADGCGTEADPTNLVNIAIYGWGIAILDQRVFFYSDIAILDLDLRVFIDSDIAIYGCIVSVDGLWVVPVR